MTIEMRKAQLIQRIREMDDELILAEVESILDRRYSWAFELTEEQREGIREARASVAAGGGIPDEEFWARFSGRFGTE